MLTLTVALLVAVVSSVVSLGSPLEQDNQVNLQDTSFLDPLLGEGVAAVLENEPLVNYGLTGVVTDEHWQRFSRADVNVPRQYVPSMNVTLVGKEMITIYNRTLYAFQGMRYGKSPIKELRFKPTVRAEPYWTPGGELLANHLGDKCPQKAMLGDVPSGSEDCLFINVYTPKLRTDVDPSRLPVMYYIHGGAFITGDASLYLPNKLLDRDVILVTIQYRLGTFGFFSTQDDNAPGNAALYDQIEGLKWVHDHIDGFGGDKSRVTIFGQSAGSASVNWLLLIPDAINNDGTPLFHGVIGESGSALEHWALDPDPIYSAQLIGELNGCTDGQNLTALYECMAQADADSMSMIMHNFVSEDRKKGGLGFKGAAPIVQSPNLVTTKPLILRKPEDLILDGSIKNVPLLNGANKHEGSFILGVTYSAFLVPNNLLQNFTYMREFFISDFLNSFGITDQTHALSETIQDAFFAETDLANFNTSSPGLIDLGGMFFLKAGGWETVKMHHRHAGGAKSYFYAFDFESDDTMFRWLFMGYPEMPFKKGVTHSDELMYLFSFPAVLEPYQLAIMDRMVLLWTNFATYGEPTPEATRTDWEAIGIPKWLPLTEQDRNYMLMQPDFTMAKEYADRWHISVDEFFYPIGKK